MSLIETIQKTVDVFKNHKMNGYEEKYVRDCSVLLAEIDRLNIYIHQLRGALGYEVPGDILHNPDINNGIAEALQKENAGLKEYSESRDESIKVYREEIKELKERLAENHDWYCGCGHWNGCNLSVCAVCGRTPGESIIKIIKEGM